MAEPNKDEFAQFETVAPGKDDEFDQFESVQPTAGQKANAFGQGATGAFLETAPIVGGMIAGSSIGAAGGPLAPVTVPLGAAAGAAAGYFAGKELRRGASQVTTPSGNPLAFEDMDELEPGQRPFGAAGEVVGGSMPFSSLPNIAARAGFRLPESRVGGFLNRIIDFATKNPGTAATAETVSNLGAGAGAAIAEAYSPGSQGARLAGELSGGFLNPQRIIIAGSNYGVQGVRRVFQSFSPAARETAAGKVIQSVVEAAGEDSDALIRALSDPAVAELTAGQATGSKALVALETYLARRSGSFDAESVKRAEMGLQAQRNAIELLLRTGDPAALREAASMRDRYFRTLIAARLADAENDAIAAASKITGDSPRDLAALSIQASKAMETVLEQARMAESELWEKVPRDIPANARAIVTRFEELKAGILPEESLPRVVEDFVSRVGGNREGLTNSGELMLFRSRMLALSREAAGKGELNDARIFGELAESAIDDLDAMTTNPAFGAFGRTPVGYDEARAFSRQLNETFTQTFAGQALASNQRGGARIPPELTMRRALAGGKEAAALRLKEIEEATGFLASQNMNTPEAAAAFDGMLDAQKRVLRLTAAEAIDPNTGRVSPTRLARFISQNDALLEKFPEIRADLVDAVKSENGRAMLERAAGIAERVIDRRAAFAQVAKTENPALVVRDAVKGATPANDIRALSKLAKRGGPAAEDGLRASVIDFAFSEATKRDGVLDFGRLKSVMFAKVAPGQSSLVQTLRQEGVLSEQEVKRLAEFVERGVKIEAAMKGGKGVDQIMQDADGLTDLIMRIAGAKAGATVAGGTSGATLIAAGRGSAFVRKMFDKVPQGKVTDVVKEAALNPKFMAKLLEKTSTQAEGIMLARQINGFLFNAGIQAIEDDE